MRRKDWKFKMVFSAVLGVGVIVFLLSVITYMNFIKKSVEYNEKIIQLTFQNGEENIMNKMGEAEKSLSHLVNDRFVYEFYENDFQDKKDWTRVTREVVRTFNEMIELNPNIYGLALVSGAGKTVVSTGKGSTQGKTEISDSIWEFMENSGKNYPYVDWFYYEEADIKKNQPLHKLIQKPVLLGMRAMGESENPEEDVYLLIALDEESLSACYGAADIYQEGDTFLLNERQRILSSSDKEKIGGYFSEEKGVRNISYGLRYHDWTLVNSMPEKIYFGDAVSILKLGLILTAATLIGGMIFIIFWLRRYTRPIQVLMENMKMVEQEQLDFPKPEPLGLAELDALNVQFYYTVQKLKQYIARIKKVEDEKTKEELKALQYQINPHFLANSLNSIRWMAILADQNKVADSLAVLSRVFIPMLRNPGLTWTLKDEISFIENYVEMMKIRYGDIIEYHLECEDRLYYEEFPRFILQPIIENCFVHRFESAGIEHIYLKIRKEKRFLVSVRNTGGVIEPEKLEEINRKISGEENGKEEISGENIGLRNVRKRLYYLYGDYGKITVFSDKEIGVMVKITF
ncbi:MAG: histidine kinase [Blautia sp.]